MGVMSSTSPIRTARVVSDAAKPGLLFVPSNADGDQLVTTLVGELGTLSTMTMLSSGIASHFRSGVNDFIDFPGVRHLVTSEDASGAHVGVHLFEVSDAIFRDPSAHRLHDECFGPVALIVRYGNGAAWLNNNKNNVMLTGIFRSAASLTWRPPQQENSPRADSWYLGANIPG